MANSKLIRDNVSLLSDKKELNWERFLGEFKKMIGKTDLSRAVKLMVDLGMYRAIFGIDSKINDFTKFQHARSVGEMAYMMFDQEPVGSIIELIRRNITNSADNLSVVSALIDYNEKVKSKNLDNINRVITLANIYNKGMNPIDRTGPGVDVLLNSFYIEPQDREIAEKFASGQLPVGPNDVALKGDEIISFIKRINWMSTT